MAWRGDFWCSVVCSFSARSRVVDMDCGGCDAAFGVCWFSFVVGAVESGVGTLSGFCHRTPGRCREARQSWEGAERFGVRAAVTPLLGVCWFSFAVGAVESGVGTLSGFCHRTPRRWREARQPWEGAERFGVRAAVTPLLGVCWFSFVVGAVESGVGTLSGFCHRTPGRWRDFFAPILLTPPPPARPG
jgi:hypothetical protein